jgi:hypothetical protein
MSSIRVLFATTVALIALVALIVLGEGQARADSGLQIEVREPTKARLISADVWIRTLKGAVVRKVYAAAGRVKVTNAPVGTFELEARSRQGNLVGRAKIVIKANALARAVISTKPAPTKRVAARVARPPVPGAAAKRATGRRATVTRRATVRRNAVRGRSTGRSPTTAKRTQRSTTRSTARSPRVGRPPVGAKPVRRAAVVKLPASRDWGKGKVRVCRGDVFDAKGRRVSGRIQIYSGKSAIGFANVTSGYFSLYDLKTATYQLRFATKDGSKRVTGNVAIVGGKLGKVVLKVQ